MGCHSPPTVYFTTPVSGDHLHETITVGVRARDRDGAIKHIEVFANGQSIAFSDKDPLNVKWDTRNVAVGGPTVLEAVATDSSGLETRDVANVVIDRGTLPTDEEAIYSLANDGDLAAADNLLQDIWDLGARSSPVHIAPITWTENYFDEYWLFLFYGLRPLADLTWAYYAMNDTRYRDKMMEILSSYLDYDEKRDLNYLTFEDFHTAAFRAMALVNCYGRLSRSHDLAPELALRLRAAILKVAGFLEDPAHFEGNYNHGFTEAAGLLLVATNFPESDRAATWQAIALARLDSLMGTAVDGDNVEVEKSPFYHFYVMNFANEIVLWAQKYGVPISQSFIDKALAMTRYSTYVAQPNGEVPLVGASVELDARRQSRAINEYLGTTDPRFQYTRTGGREGVEPSLRNVLFVESGHSILRSGFGLPGDAYDGQTHILFNVGPYRTKHSHLDGLSLVYASAGQTLLTDSGLFAYDPSPEQAYFRSTAAHNTVVVDGKSQDAGVEHAGSTLTGPDWVYQSGSHRLYNSVLHRRGVLLLSRDLALVIDRLESLESHDYAQTWHFPPEAAVAADVTRATAVDGAEHNLVVLQQALPDQVQAETVRGSKSPLQGWHSPVYGNMTENTVAVFHITGNEATFATLIASGPLAEKVPRIVVDSAAEPWGFRVCKPEAGIALAVALGNLAVDGESVKVVGAEECRAP